MKKVFYFAVLLYVLIQILNRYLVMPFPGSQELSLIDFSHALNYWKAYIDFALILVIIYPLIRIYKEGVFVLPSIMILLAISTYIYFNCYFTAENRFRKPNNLLFATPETSEIDENTPVIGVELNGYAKAFPISLILYHHQVVDEINGQKIVVTYCGVCRTGRVYIPEIDNGYSDFKLVGVYHQNAVFEDVKTRSWWSQETGRCIAGKLKGSLLPEFIFNNMSLGKWVELHPGSMIMQPDPKYMNRYQLQTDDYNLAGNSFDLSRTIKKRSKDSFVVGLLDDTNAKAIEWDVLYKSRVINDTIGKKTFTLVLSDDNISFNAFQNPVSSPAILRNDTIFINEVPFDLYGRNLRDGFNHLIKMKAYREYWFSWKYAYPNTTRYKS